MKQLVAITGGIGSGKSTVAAHFESFGVPVYNSDEAAKTLMNTSNTLKKEITKLFGNEAYTSTGELNKKYIATQIFSDNSKRTALNSLVHPAVRIDFQRWVAFYESNTSIAYLLYESALVFENQMQDQFFGVIYVTAPLEARISRIKIRDGRSRDEILRIISTQSNPLDLNKSGLYTIYNDKPSNTMLKSKEIHIKILQKIQKN